MKTNPDMLYLPYRLKEVNRRGTVGNRWESAAEHNYSSMMLASYYIRFYPDLNFERVMKIILFHDLVEIFAGDTFILDDEALKLKYKRETMAFEKLLCELPLEFAGELKVLWPEYLYGQTKEARFVKAIDSLDPMIHSIYKPEEWTRYNFTEKKLRQKKEKYFSEFKELKEMFEQILVRLKASGAI
ncbi:MAG: HD domain-containing protein [Candidatus Woesearchaeota archaeon]